MNNISPIGQTIDITNNPRGVNVNNQPHPLSMTRNKGSLDYTQQHTHHANQ